MSCLLAVQEDTGQVSWQTPPSEKVRISRVMDCKKDGICLYTVRPWTLNWNEMAPLWRLSNEADSSFLSSFITLHPVHWFPKIPFRVFQCRPLRLPLPASLFKPSSGNFLVHCWLNLSMHGLIVSACHCTDAYIALNNGEIVDYDNSVLSIPLLGAAIMRYLTNGEELQRLLYTLSFAYKRYHYQCLRLRATTGQLVPHASDCLATWNGHWQESSFARLDVFVLPVDEEQLSSEPSTDSYIYACRLLVSDNEEEIQTDELFVPSTENPLPDRDSATIDEEMNTTLWRRTWRWLLSWII